MDARELRRVFGLFTTGVTVVTAVNPGPEPVGVTANSVTSVSLDPPLVGFLPMVSSDRWHKIRASGAFCVNVLGHAHGDLCWQFAKSSIERPFEGVAWHPSEITGSPVLDEAIAHMDCTIAEVVDAGDHHFVMGRVVELGHADADTEPVPLLFYRGGLGRFQAH